MNRKKEGMISKQKSAHYTEWQKGQMIIPKSLSQTRRFTSQGVQYPIEETAEHACSILNDAAGKNVYSVVPGSRGWRVEKQHFGNSTKEFPNT